MIHGLTNHSVLWEVTSTAPVLCDYLAIAAALMHKPHKNDYKIRTVLLSEKISFMHVHETSDVCCRFASM